MLDHTTAAATGVDVGREERAHPHARRRASRRRHLPAADAGQGAGAARAQPLRQGTAGARADASAAGAAEPAVGRRHRGRRYQRRDRARLRPRDRRRARHRRLGRRARRQLRSRRPRRGQGRLRPGRMDGAAALVRRQCRHDRHFLFRHRAGDGRRRGAAPPQGDLRQRRPLRHVRALLSRRHHVADAAGVARGPRRRQRRRGAQRHRQEQTRLFARGVPGAHPRAARRPRHQALAEHDPRAELSGDARSLAGLRAQSRTTDRSGRTGRPSTPRTRSRSPPTSR